ncbi:myosin-binding protein 1-like [Zingiber officinale]|uniref:GTD-binding domain-containing protein n=1 Tax=Zingiber officinale TaxID=94328 RepID=A0A8J5KU50_ZINOF|nr:myosin-binding protein 1-like [Zingiber officinale]KAG6489828.1 hypothetical protein ZIOFF_051108 [Zingiber officinale]
MPGAAESLGFFSFYKTAICECFLIAFLLYNAALAYLATRFARFCNLPPPCLLCSRLDNLLGGGERNGFYKRLFCHAHKVEISSMVYCHDHKKLADLRDMCHACLLSSTTVSATCHETYTLLGRNLKLKPDDHNGDGDGGIPNHAPPSSNHKLRPTPAGTSVCSCCSGTFQRPTPKKQPKRAVEPYDELKLPSDSDSEASLSENCDGYPQSRATKAAKEKSRWRRRLPPSMPFSYRTSPKTASTEKVPEKLIHPCTPGGAMKLNGEVKNNPEQVHRSIESSVRGNGFKKAIGNRGFILSPRFSEVVAGKESSRAQEDLKQRLSRALDSLWSNEATASPRIDDLKSSDASAAALQNLASRLSISRCNSSMDFAAIVSDVEGETSIARLKQQVEMDRKSISALCKELEEERSASTVAVNEAMAMITRLQEEKAAMQMEASQYLRLLEEQAEYDQEAIEKLNELLDEREKECLDMEAELETFRRDSSSTAAVKLCGAACGAKDLLLNLEQEKFQVSDSLKKLQNKLALFSAKQQPPPPPLAGEETGEEDPEIGSLKDEVSGLTQRMEAIEEDREFLRQALAALRHGAEGMQLVQDIAWQLKGLRRELKEGIMAN